jgi:hypothetical protein
VQVTGRVWKGSAFGGVKGRTELPGIVDDYLAGKLWVDQFVTHTQGLEDINKGFEDMKVGQAGQLPRNGTISGCAIVHRCWVGGCGADEDRLVTASDVSWIWARASRSKRVTALHCIDNALGRELCEFVHSMQCQ